MSPHEKITEKIITALKEDIVPWKSGLIGKAGFPHNLKSLKPYRGVNILLLWLSNMFEGFRSNYWLTFKQARQLGGHVKRGSTATQIFFYEIRKKDKKDERGRPVLNEKGEPAEVRYPIFRLWSVFNSDQVAGIQAPDQIENHLDPIESAEEIVRGYKDKPKIVHRVCHPGYIPEKDIVELPESGYFTEINRYYEALFHELSHSTGHEKRLNRPGLNTKSTFGSESYSFEELIAEISTCFLMNHAGVQRDDDFQNQVGYISSWIKALENDPKMIVKASSEASRATNYVLEAS